MMAMDIIVSLAIAFTILFVAAWLVSPTLRAWIERPKYRFLADMQTYDQIRRAAHGSDESERPA